LSPHDLERKLFLSGILLVPLLWIGLLSVSSKQAWRYALPSAGFLYILAGFGAWKLLRCSVGRYKNVLANGAIVLLVASQAFAAVLWYPNYHLYFNAVSGGLPGALERGHPFTFSGQIDAVRFLMSQRDHQNRDSLLITVFGDSEGLEDTAHHLYPDKPDKALWFTYFKRPMADYVITFDSHRQLIPESGWSDVLETEPAYEAFFKGARVLAVYRVPPYPFDEPLVIPPADAHHAIGRTGRVAGIKGSFLIARPEHDRAGFLFFSTAGYGASAGEYLLSAEALLPEFPVELPGETLVAELQLNGCKKPVPLTSLRSTAQPIVLRCQVSSDGRLLPKVYWRGKVPFAIKSMTIEKVQ
jgi:hypothetical protein